MARRVRKFIEFFMRFAFLSAQMKLAKTLDKRLKLEARAAKLEKEIDMVFPR